MTKSNYPTPSRSGTFSHVAGLLRVAARYVSARVQLIGVEMKEAGLRYGVAAVLVAGALFIAILGYVFLVVAAVFGIAAAFDAKHAWIWVLGGAAILHLAGAFALVMLARRRLRSDSFPLTLEEFKKDQTWLNNLENNP